MKKTKKVSKTLDIIFTYLILLAVSFIFLFPCLWLILASFSKSGSIYSFNGFFPKEYSLDTFKKLFLDTTMYNFPRWFINSLVVGIFSSLFGTILVVLTAYVISFFEFKMRKPLMKITLVLGMFPSFMGMAAVYILMTQFKMVNSLWGLILIYSAGAPMGYLVQKGFFDTVSHSLDEAAMIDGANKNTIFFRIILPLSKPIIIYTILMAFTAPWGDYMMASFIAQGRTNMFTVAVGLQQWLSKLDFATYFNRFCAGGVLTSIPIMVLFFWLQKYYVSGVTGGAVKG